MTTPTGRIREAVDRMQAALFDRLVYPSKLEARVTLKENDARLLAEALPLLAQLPACLHLWQDDDGNMCGRVEETELLVSIIEQLAALDRGTEAK